MANNEEITLHVSENSPYVIGARAYVEQTENGAVITIIDKEGTTTATVSNGKGIASATLNEDYTLTLIYTDGTSVTTTSIRGEQGESGVYCGSEEPDNPDVDVWIDPTGDPYPMEDEIADAVDEWITAHPEYVTTVQDGAITVPKFAAGVVDTALNKVGYPAESKATGDAIAADRTRLTAVEGEADALDARITNLAQLTDGSTTGDAELMDARVVGSTTYSTLHEAIDTEFTNVKSALNENTNGIRFLTDTVFTEVGHGNQPQLTDSAATNMIEIGGAMVVGHTYRIYLKFNNYSADLSATNGFGKLTGFYVAKGTSGSDRVTDLKSQVYSAVDPTNSNSFANLNRWVYIDYVATDAINRLRPQYSSSYSSTSNSIDWMVIDLSQESYAPASIVPTVNAIENELINTISEGSKAQSGNYGANAIALGATMYEGKEYSISLYFDGEQSAFTSMLRNIYVATSDASGGRIADILSLFLAIESPMQSYKWYTVDYTPTANITYIGCAYSSSYVASESNILRYKVTEKESRITQLENAIEEGTKYNYTPINTWEENAVPTAITSKLHDMDDDVLLVCQGDSLTALIEYCDAQEEPEHCPAGMQYKSWTYLLWKNLARVKPLCDRLDSQRGGSDFFTKVGTWEQVSGAKFDDDDYAYDFEHERSVASLTYQSASSNAAISFTFDADTYDKCNIVFSLKPDGANCEIAIAEGNGKMLVSLDRSTWVEANGFTHTQLSNPDGLSYSQIQAAGLAVQQRHRRLWMKKANSVTGDVTITYKRSSTQTLITPYMYCWGVERWSGNTVFVDNIGRGGRYTKTLSYNISDIFDRNPDFAMFEMPLANETDEGLANIYGFYEQYFTSSGNNSYKTRSENYTKVPLIVILPHGRGTFFDADDNAIFDTAHQVANDPPAYVIYMDIFDWLKEQLASYSNVAVNNLYVRLLNEAAGVELPIKTVFGSNGEDALTQDTTHLNQRGARMYLKYLLSLFQR